MKLINLSRLLKIALLLSVSLTTSAVSGQIAADYFLPGEGKNLSIYGVPPYKKMKFLDEIKTHVFYSAKGDSVLITTINYDKDSIQSWTKQVYKISPNEILLVKETSNKDGGKYYQEESVLFKMPVDSKKIEWADLKNSGSVGTTYSAEYSTVSVNGKKSKAIKVTTSTYKKKSQKELISTIDYYVSGIGLYKTTSTDNFVIQKLEDQKQTAELPALR